MRQGFDRGRRLVETGGLQLISGNDPKPVSVINRNGRSRIVLTCEHAGNCIPESLGILGLEEISDLSRHIAWDVGAAATARHIANQIDAPLVLQNYSRLLIDCNRPENSVESIPLISDGTKVVGNDNLTAFDRKRRFSEIVLPFHKSVERLLDERIDRNETPLVFAIHSFTPNLKTGETIRPWDLGLLYNRDNRLAVLFRQSLEDIDHDLLVADNEPYAVCDDSDYTIPVHCEKRGVHGLLLEIRNDHLVDEKGVSSWGDFLSNLLMKIDNV